MRAGLGQRSSRAKLEASRAPDGLMLKEAGLVNESMWAVFNLKVYLVVLAR